MKVETLVVWRVEKLAVCMVVLMAHYSVDSTVEWSVESLVVMKVDW